MFSECDLPSSEHLDQVLLRRPCLIRSPQSREDTILPQQSPSARPLDIHVLFRANVCVRWNNIKVEVLSKNYNCGPVLLLQNVDGVRHLIHILEFGGVTGCLRNTGTDIPEKIEHVLQACRVKLYKTISSASVFTQGVIVRLHQQKRHHPRGTSSRYHRETVHWGIVTKERIPGESIALLVTG